MPGDVAAGCRDTTFDAEALSATDLLGDGAVRGLNVGTRVDGAAQVAVNRALQGLSRVGDG
jgi:hypothetical protein